MRQHLKRKGRPLPHVSQRSSTGLRGEGARMQVLASYIPNPICCLKVDHKARAGSTSEAEPSSAGSCY